MLNENDWKTKSKQKNIFERNIFKMCVTLYSIFWNYYILNILQFKDRTCIRYLLQKNWCQIGQWIRE